MHFANATEETSKLVLLTTENEEFLLGQTRTCGVVEVAAFEFLEACNTLRDGAEVREHAAEPALVDIRHTNTGCLCLDRFLGLLRGADEKDRATVGNGFLHEVVGAVDVTE